MKETNLNPNAMNNLTFVSIFDLLKRTGIGKFNIGELESPEFKIGDVADMVVDISKFYRSESKAGVHASNAGYGKNDYAVCILDNVDKPHEYKSDSIYIEDRAVNIYSIEVLQENKVIRVIFYDDSYKNVYKEVIVICSDSDTFDFRKGIFIAISKYLWGSIYTPEGIEYKANELMMTKYYTNLVDKTIKRYNKAKKQLDIEIQQEKERVEKKKAKQIERKKLRRERLEAAEVEKQINIYTEAIKRALNESNNTQDVQNRTAKKNNKKDSSKK